jgi:alkanesulfonate monooxygenase SsuD/methylene tetrahydromethanopterin reductase-like flavin-dependent oxidoreductase (luciferase family)
MQFSVWPTNQQPLADIVAVARHAEATGWDGVWSADHLMPSVPPLDLPIAECWTTMTALILTVPRLRVGSLVLSNTFRHPGVLAKMAATLGVLAQGRLVLGLGAGWQENEHEAHGIDLPAPGPRVARLDEACAIVRGMLDDGAVSFSGRFYDVREVVAEPRPESKVSLLLGVKGDRSIGVAARWADEWNSWTTPDLFRERLAVLERHCAAIGRDPSTIHRSTQAVVAFADRDSPLAQRWGQGGRALLFGSAAQMHEQLADYEAAGVDEFVVPDFALGRGNERLDAMDRFITEVAAPFRRAE